MEFFFCEKCGKRLTDQDIQAGKARHKQVKGVFCAGCAEGVMTMEFEANSPEMIEQFRKEQKEKQRRGPTTSAAVLVAAPPPPVRRPAPADNKWNVDVRGVKELKLVASYPSGADHEARAVWLDPTAWRVK